MTQDLQKEVERHFGELTWVCQCGSSNIIEIEPPSGGWYDLDCRQCGLVGSVSVRPKTQIKPAKINLQTPPTPAKERCEHKEWGYEHVRQEYMCLYCMETRKETPNPPEDGL